MSIRNKSHIKKNIKENKMISVIIPTYNRGKLINRAVDSVLSQSYENLEIIVVDDCSTDNTTTMMEKYRNNEKVKYIKLDKNAGACHARNVGIKKASGEVIAFLDSDDEWHREKLQKQYNYMIEKKADVVVCNYLYEKSNHLKPAIVKQNQIISYEQLLYENCITTGAVLVNKKVLENVDYFDENMPRYQDWELMLRIAKKYQIHFLDENLLTLHFQKQSISNSTSKAKKYIALEKIYNKNEKELKKDKKAYAHICWSMGMYSLYLDKKREDLLKIGVYGNGTNYKRLCIYILIKCKLDAIVKRMYSKNH